jgi:tetratricopeptide (TPR) repeat protein
LVAGCATTPESGPATTMAPAGLSPERAQFADALAHFSRGISHEWDRDAGGAFTSFQQAAQLDPDNEELQFRVALLLLQDRRTDEAVAIMERLARRHPRSERAQLWTAFVYRAVDQPEKALRAYHRAVEAAPDSPIAYIEQASLYAKLDRVEEAMDLLERALDRVAEPADLLRALGDIYIRQAALSARNGETPRRLKAALRIFARAVEQRPDDQSLLFQLGDLYLLNGDFEKAISCFERIEALNPNDLRIKQKLAMSLMASGNRAKALATLEQIAAKDPDNARVLYYLAQVQEQGGDFEAAGRTYERALQAAPREPASYLRLAMIRMAADDAPGAVRVLEDGLAHLPEDSRFLELLAYVHLGQRDYKNALAFFTRTRELLDATHQEPLTPNFHLNHAIATQLAGQPSEAASLLYQAMGINRAYLQAYVHYMSREASGTNISQSVNVLTQLGEKAPDDPGLFLYLGLLNSYAKLYPAAVAAFEKAEKLAMEADLQEDVLTPSFFFWFGAACERNGEFDRAVGLFQRCIALEPAPADRVEHKAYVDALNYLAYMWAERGIELDQALAYVQRALAAHPQSAAYRDTLGWIHFMQARYDEALREISRAFDLLPDDPTITDHLGDVHDKLGHADDAVTWWKRSFVLEPENEKVAAKLLARSVDLEPLRQEAEELKRKQQAEAAAEPEMPMIDLGPEGDTAEPDAGADEPLPEP